jgi:hypothetical protein
MIAQAHDRGHRPALLYEQASPGRTPEALSLAGHRRNLRKIPARRTPSGASDGMNQLDNIAGAT